MRLIQSLGPGTNILASALGLLLSLSGCKGSTEPGGTALIASRLAFTLQPTNAAIGAAITPPVQVVVQDAQGNTVTTATTSKLDTTDRPWPANCAGRLRVGPPPARCPPLLGGRSFATVTARAVDTCGVTTGGPPTVRVLTISAATPVAVSGGLTL